MKSRARRIVEPARRRIAVAVVTAAMVVAAVAMAADGPAGAGRDRLGAPCRSVHRYPVTFVAGPHGTVEADFAFAGGATHGHRALTTDERRLARTHGAYVADVQLGTDEPVQPDRPAGGLMCRLDPTFHFLCPSTDTLDRLCLTWVDEPALRRP